MLNSTKKMPSPDDLERAERLREVIESLKEATTHFPVIVEGKRDADALKKLGLEGEILMLHRGQSLYDFCEEVLDHHSRVVILLDWDEKGESLFRTIAGYLKGHWEEFSPIRNILKVLCQKDIRDVEGIPKLLSRLEGNE